MAQANPFADLIPAQPAAAGQPPARIYGGPKPVDPMEQARFQLSVNSDARADAAAARADATAQRQAAAAERQARVDEAKIGKESQLTESQSKDTNFYNGALGAEQEWRRLTADPKLEPGTEAPGQLGDAARAILPRGIINQASSSERQQANQAKENFIRASLRLESGAAIGDQEYYRQDKAFFPQTGDGPDVIAQKARARQQMIEGFRITAGPGAEKIDKLRGVNAGPNGEVTFSDQAPAQVSNAVKLTTEQESAFKALAQSGAGPEALQSFARNLGLQISPEQLDATAKFYAKEGNRGIEPTVSVDNTVQAINPGDGAAGAFVRGVANTGSLGFVNRLGALADAVGGEDYGKALDRRRGYDAYDEQNEGLARGVGQFAGGFAIPVVGTATAANLARNGAAAGALYGLGNSYGSASDRLLAAGSNAVAGGALGYGLGRAGEWLAGRGGPSGPTGGGSELMAAADRQGVSPLPADVGGPMTRRFTAAAAQGPLSAGPIIRGGQRVSEEIGAARDRVAAGVGQVMQPVEAGEAAQQGARTYIDQSRQQVGRLYDRARDTAGGVKPVPERALAAVDDNLRELAETPNTSAPVTKALESLRGDLGAEGGLSIDGLRRLRTNVRGLAQTDDLRGTDFQRRAGQVLDAISDDISNGLPPEARAQFRAADQAYRERIKTIDEVIKPIVGGKNEKAFGPEKVFSNLQNASRSDSARLRRFMDTLPQDEQTSVRATVIGHLGKASAGEQGADGNSFSPGQFLTQWNQLTPRAKDVLFKGETRDALNDLARIAEGTKQAQGYANRSNTGGAVLGNVGALFGIGSVSPTAAIAGATGQLITGRLLASPAFARWLARPASTSQQIAAAAKRLSVIAARQPEIANDLLPIQQALQTSVSKAAAENQKQQRR